MHCLKHGALLFAFVLIPCATSFAQFSGSRGGVPGASAPGGAASGLEALRPEVAQGYITIEGQVERRVKPTEIRIVLAVTAEGKTPAECRRRVHETTTALKVDWQKMQIAPDKIVEDFIAVLPRYEFEIEKIRDRDVAVEKKVGYLMQSNLHVAVRDDAQAMSTIQVAFNHGVADVIAFDYWSRDLDETKVQVRAAAIQAARKKSDVLLGALFDQRPPLINLQESTEVHYPESLYESFTNSSDSEYQTNYSRRDTPMIRTYRPKNTYYRGLYLDGDVQSKDLPMQSEISVVSTVRLYFESPAAAAIRTSQQEKNH